MAPKPLTPDMKRILEEHGAIAIVEPWMLAEGLRDVKDIGFFSTDEKEVPANFTSLLELAATSSKGIFTCTIYSKGCTLPILYTVCSV